MTVLEQSRKKIAFEWGKTDNNSKNAALPRLLVIL
jgi:hypothetical protein